MWRPTSRLTVNSGGSSYQNCLLHTCSTRISQCLEKVTGLVVSGARETGGFQEYRITVTRRGMRSGKAAAGSLRRVSLTVCEKQLLYSVPFLSWFFRVNIRTVVIVVVVIKETCH